MNILAVVAVLSALALSGATAQKPSKLYDYRIKLGQNKTSTFADKPCEQSGLHCKNCRELVNCNWDSSTNSYLPEPVAICPTGQRCKNKNCEVGDDPTCSPTIGIDFTCGSPGVFPDPNDCGKYHVCGLVESTGQYQEFPINCDNEDKQPYGYRYNAKTYFCDQKLASTACGYPVPLCVNEFDTAALKDNPSLYFTCYHYGSSGLLYPYQLACPNGKKYNPAIRKCA